jgi:hypothetical protein
MHVNKFREKMQMLVRYYPWKRFALNSKVFFVKKNVSIFCTDFGLATDFFVQLIRFYFALKPSPMGLHVMLKRIICKVFMLAEWHAAQKRKKIHLLQ